jgi:putative ABC transport system permease protein
MSNGWSNDVVLAADAKADSKKALSFFAGVSPGFFDVLGIPVLAGRDIAESDSAQSAKVAVVNRAFARKVFGTENALGRQFIKEDGVRQLPKIFQVIGIVGDTKIESLREENRPMAYLSDPQYRDGNVGEKFVVHSTAPLRDTMSGVLNAVAEVNPAISVNFHVFKTEIQETLVPESLMATLSGFFGLLAGLLAVIGLYGVISYMVAQRRNEIGIRMALGAATGTILSMVLRGAGTLILTGIVVGAGLAVLAARTANSLLYGLRPYDPGTLLLSVVLLASVSFLAAAIPARRAARVDPMGALRDE